MVQRRASSPGAWLSQPASVPRAKTPTRGLKSGEHYKRYLARGAGALEDGQPAPRRVWNKLPDTVAQAVVGLALKEPELSPRELAVSFIDQQHYFVSESSVYRLLKAHDLIPAPPSS